MYPTAAPQLTPQQAMMQAQAAALMGGGQPVDPWAAVIGGPQVAATPLAGQDAYGAALQQSGYVPQGARPQPQAPGQYIDGNANAARLTEQQRIDAIKAEKLRQMMIKRGDIKK